MFGDLPKLLDRDFAIGYFLPVACFLGSLYGLLAIFHHTGFLAPLQKSNVLIGATTLTLFTWLIGILLLVLNRQVYMVFSGHKWPLWTSNIAVKRFHSSYEELHEVFDKEKLCNESGEDPAILVRKRIEIQKRVVECFPPEEHLVSSTDFGNAISAAVQYPKIMYGTNAIEAWARLLAVLPKDYRVLVDSAKAQTDFWVNLCLLSIIFFPIYLVLAGIAHHFSAWWLPIISITISCMTYRGAVNAAKEWGVFFKACFDIFLPELYIKLRFTPPSDADVEWDTWDKFSKAVSFRDRPSLPVRTQWQEKNSEEHSAEEDSAEEDSAEDESPEEGKDEAPEKEDTGNAESKSDQQDAEKSDQPVSGEVATIE